MGVNCWNWVFNYICRALLTVCKIVYLDILPFLFKRFALFWKYGNAFHYHCVSMTSIYPTGCCVVTRINILWFQRNWYMGLWFMILMECFQLNIKYAAVKMYLLVHTKMFHYITKSRTKSFHVHINTRKTAKSNFLQNL